MSLNRKKFLALAAALVAGGAMAQGYPAKPITLVVPAAAGGTTDLAGRMLAQALTPVVGQQVVVDNKAGGNGAIAASLVKRAPAGTPKAIVDQLNAEVLKALDDKDVIDKLAGVGAEPFKGTPSQLGALVKSDLAQWKQVVQDTGAKVD